MRAGGRTGRAMQFFSWTSHAAVGCGLVEPRWLAWDPEVTLCALAYEDGVTLAAVRPQFKAIAALPLAHATSGIWHKHQLFLATPTAVVLVFAAAGGGGGRMVGLGGSGDPFVEVHSRATHPAVYVHVTYLQRHSVAISDRPGAPVRSKANHGH